MKTLRITAEHVKDRAYIGPDVSAWAGHIEIASDLGTVFFAGAVVAYGHIYALTGSGIKAGGDIEAGEEIVVGEEIDSGRSIVAGGKIEAGRNIVAGDGIDTCRNIKAGGEIVAGWGIAVGVGSLLAAGIVIWSL